MSFCNRCCGVDRCCLTPIPGPQGPQGPRGATGSTGPSGQAFNTLGSFYNPSEQVITTGTPVALTNTIFANNVSLSANAVTVGNTGTYLINYGVNFVNNAVAGNNIFIAVNGAPVAGTERQINAFAMTSSSTILNLTAGSTITLRPTATGLTISAAGGVSAFLNLTQIA